tara:strand:- start:235 stop:387 length:153 start_codon:yes stop_codon:yes gene_type:complete
VIRQLDEVGSFIAVLEKCFLNDYELVQWQNGPNFEDPWPQQVAKLKQPIK